MEENLAFTFFTANIIGEKGAPTTTQEDELNIKIKWLDVEEVLTQLKNQTLFRHPEWYQRQFNSHSYFAAVSKYLSENK